VLTSGVSNNFTTINDKISIPSQLIFLHSCVLKLCLPSKRPFFPNSRHTQSLVTYTLVFLLIPQSCTSLKVSPQLCCWPTSPWAVLSPPSFLALMPRTRSPSPPNINLCLPVPTAPARSCGAPTTTSQRLSHVGGPILPSHPARSPTPLSQYPPLVQQPQSQVWFPLLPERQNDGVWAVSLTRLSTKLFRRNGLLHTTNSEDL